MLYIFDYAHGDNVSGKCSPPLPNTLFQQHLSSPVIYQGRFRERLFSRYIINNVRKNLEEDETYPYITELSHFGNDEPGLQKRVNRINAIDNTFTGEKLVISQHNNAAGSGVQWMNARGFCVYTTRGQTKADYYAEFFIEMFSKRFPDFKIRRELTDGDSDYEANFKVLTCRPPAMLIELGFQDNLEDIKILLDEGFQTDYINMFTEFCKEMAK